MINNIVTIRNEKDMADFFEKMDDAEYLKKKLQNFDGTLIKLKLEGDNFESSLTGSVIIGLAKFQERIYEIYLTSQYGPGTRRKVTPEEAGLLEIKVTINKGSTEALIELAFKTIMGALENMTPEQIQATLYTLAAIIAGGLCLHGIGSKAVVGAFKSRRKSLALKKAKSKNKVEKKKIETQESVLKTAIEAVREMGDGILRARPKLIEINDKTVSADSVASAVEELKPEKPEMFEDQGVITGLYRIQRVTLDFKKDTASADVFNVKTGDPIHGLVLQPKSISDGSYRVLKTAQDKRDIKMQIIVTRRNDRIYRAVLDKILE
jgi:hypothetical protein